MLDTIERAAREATASRRVTLVNVFRDSEYNRTGFTLAGAVVDEVRGSALDIAKVSLQELDLSAHDATHPRVGVVDHVSCHALRGERMHAAELAQEIGQGLASFGVPVKLYGDASHDGIGLAEIRRQCGYFDGASDGLWTGKYAPRDPGFAFDCSPAEVAKDVGICMVGAVPWVCNFNVPLEITWEADVDASDRRKRTLALGRVVAKRVSARGGGLPSVQSMALLHGDNEAEIACNLLDTTISSTEDVQRAVASIVAKMKSVDHLGPGALVRTREGYVTNQTPQSILAAVDGQQSL